MAPLRALIVTETFPPEINGVSLTVSGYCGALRDAGFDVHLLRPRQPSDADGPPPGVHLCAGVGLPRYRGLRFGLPALGETARVFDAVKPDIVYIATEGPLGAAALQAARRRAVPVVSGYHTDFPSYARHYGAAVLRRPVIAYLRWFHNAATATLVGTPELERSLAERGFANVIHAPRGVDLGLFAPWRRDRALRARWAARADTPVVLHVGRLAREKNLKLACDAFAHIRAARPDARMVFVGDGPERARLEREQPEAVFCGMQTGERLAEHYASADILLFPSETETFGNVTLEALASGLAVVAYDYAAAHALIEDGRNGLVAHRGDTDRFIAQALRTVLDPALASALRREARKSMDGFDVVQVHARFADLLRRIAGAGVIAAA